VVCWDSRLGEIMPSLLLGKCQVPVIVLAWQPAQLLLFVGAVRTCTLRLPCSRQMKNTNW
jgi:hypothetical protein